MGDEGFVKIRVEIPDQEITGEGLWARPLGGALYEVGNVPFFAFDLNYGDVVRCAEPPDERPVVLRVVRRSGHKTLRVVFRKGTAKGRRDKILRRLKAMRVSYERAWGAFYALDVPPEADYGAVCDYLWAKEQEGLLEYQTGRTSAADEAP